MKFSLEQNTAENKDTVPYFVRVEFLSSTIDLSNTLHIPVYPKLFHERDVYIAEACGYQVHAEELDQIPALVFRLLQGMIAANRLPSYAFVARYSRNIHLVYTIGDEVTVKIPNGPSFRHVELAKVREYLSDYLRQTGLLGTRNQPDKLHARGIHRKSLALIRPIFYLKKRSPAEEKNDFWAPVFLSDDRSNIYAFAANQKRATPVKCGHEIFDLYTKVTNALIADNRLQSPFDLQIDRLFPEQLNQLKGNITKLDEMIRHNEITIPVYQNGPLYLSIEDRPDEERYNLHLADSLSELRQRIRHRLENRYTPS
ncbi:MAG: hypothetical protein AAF629_16365 [Chloroflexota bacterium]